MLVAHVVTVPLSIIDTAVYFVIHVLLAITEIASILLKRGVG